MARLPQRTVKRRRHARRSGFLSTVRERVVTQVASNTWQLIINTGTTIVTFLMVFLVQNSQNHDSLALHLKLDELLRATEAARNSLVDLQSMSEQELDELGA